MKKIIIVILFIIVSISCQNKSNDNIKKEFYPSGNLKTLKTEDSIKMYYDTLPKIIKGHYLKNGEVVKYYKNGKTFLKGKLNNNEQRIGEWEFFTNEGYLSEIREYYIIDDKSYINQRIYFDEDGNKLYYKIESFNYYNQNEFQSENLENVRSKYAEFDLGKDTIYLNEPWRAASFYHTPLFRDKNSQMIIVLHQEGTLFNEDFSNIREVKKDTFFSIAKDIENQKWFPDDDPDYTVIFGRWFDSPGEKIIRGFLTEFYEEVEHNTTTLVESKIFFEKFIYVKDTLN